MNIVTLNMSKFFTLDENIRRLERLPEIKTPVMDLIYPESKRSNYPRSVIAPRDLPGEVKNVPVVKRGTQAVPLVEKNGARGYEPFPIEVSMTLTAADLNDIISLGFNTQQAEIDQKVDRMRRTARATTEALAAQSLTGSIAYSVRGALADNSELYTAEFGDTKTQTITSPWDDGDTTLADIIKDCLTMGDKAGGNGFGNQLTVLVNAATFSVVVEKIMGQSANILNIAVQNNEIAFPGFTMRRLASTYYDYQAKADVPSIPDKKACAVAVDAPHWLPYCAIDDIDAGLAPLPFFSKAVKVENPSAWELYGKSKPFPVPIVDAICWATVLT
jgi:hypothetical protein